VKITKSSTAEPTVTGKGPAENFTGDVYVDPVAVPDGPFGVLASLVYFTPGARTAWHRHPLGQSLYVTEGIGYVQRRGGPVELIQPGDRVVIEPDEEHWHGAVPNRFMVHLALNQVDDDHSAAEWGDHVTEAEYGAGADAPAGTPTP